MLTLSFKTTVKGNKKDVWNHYCEVEKWHAWDKQLEEISLDGPFETGTVGQMKLFGQPPLEFQLSDVQEYQTFSNLASTPFGKVVFDHQIKEIEAGQLSIEHSVSLLVERVTDSSMTFLQSVFKDIPQAVLTLKEVMES